MLGGPSNPGAGGQGRPVRVCMAVTDHPAAGGLLAKDRLERTAVKKTRKVNEMRPEVSSHLRASTLYAATSVTCPDAQKTLNHKMARSQKQPIHQPRICPSRGGTGLAYHLYHHPASVTLCAARKQDEHSRSWLPEKWSGNHPIQGSKQEPQYRGTEGGPEFMQKGEEKGLHYKP
ncbi:hypothetical protein GH733_001655 [Mirounga leonina]|nr:hypothetical protein GH733_001655 [Mirounga leonina]